MVLILIKSAVLFARCLLSLAQWQKLSSLLFDILLEAAPPTHLAMFVRQTRKGGGTGEITLFLVPPGEEEKNQMTCEERAESAGDRYHKHKPHFGLQQVCLKSKLQHSPPKKFF